MGWGPDGQGNDSEKMALSTLLSQTNLSLSSGCNIPFRVVLSMSLLSGPQFLFKGEALSIQRASAFGIGWAQGASW